MMHSCDILAVQNAKSLLQGLDFFLATSHTVLIALSCIHTRWLEFLVVRQCCIQFFLCSIKISLGFLKSLLSVLLLARLVLDVFGLLGLVDAGVGHELIVLLLRLSFGGAGLRLEPGKIRLDNFDHANNTAILRAHAFVWLVEYLWLLHEGCGLCSLGVK